MSLSDWLGTFWENLLAHPTVVPERALSLSDTRHCHLGCQSSLLTRRVGWGPATWTPTIIIIITMGTGGSSGNRERSNNHHLKLCVGLTPGSPASVHSFSGGPRSSQVSGGMWVPHSLALKGKNRSMPTLETLASFYANNTVHPR